MKDKSIDKLFGILENYSNFYTNEIQELETLCEIGKKGYFSISEFSSKYYK